MRVDSGPVVPCVHRSPVERRMLARVVDFLFDEVADFGTIAEAVISSRAGIGSPREVVDLTFDAFDREGGGALASWMLLSGNDDALDPIVDAIHDMIDDLHDVVPGAMREVTLSLVLLALGDALMGEPLSQSLGLPRTAAREQAERMLIEGALRAGLAGPPEAAR